MPAEIWRTVTLKNIIHHTGPQSEKKMKRKYVVREGEDSVVIMFGLYCVVEATSGQRQTVVGTLLIYKHILLPPCTKHLVNILLAV